MCQVSARPGLPYSYSVTETFLLRAGFAGAASIVLPTLNLSMNKEWSGREYLPDSGFILVANHISELDPLTLAHMVYRAGYLPHFLAKRELFDAPVLGKILTGMQQVPVDRAKGGAESLEVAENVVSDGGVVIIYPEGTITRDPQGWPMAARTGAARLALKTGAPVIPAGQWGVHEFLPRKAKKPSPFPRKTSRIAIGPAVELDDLRNGPLTRKVLVSATERMMRAITERVEILREEKAPDGIWDPTLNERRPHGEAL